MTRWLMVLTLFLVACGGDDDKNDDECLRFDVVYDGDQTAPLTVKLTHARGGGLSSWPSVELARGMNQRYWSCSNPASGGPTLIEAWVDVDRSCQFEDITAPPCEPSSGDPYIAFEEELGHGFHVVMLDFTDALAFE